MDLNELMLPMSTYRDGRESSRTQREGGDTEREYLTKSLENITMIRARYNSQISEEQRMDLTLNELNLVKKELELKAISTQFKATVYHVLNTLTSSIILLASGIITGLSAVSECVNIPIIVLSSIIFVVEGSNKLMRWGPQGVLFKTGNIKIRKLLRQARDYMYTFHNYTADQLLIFVNNLRSAYDDIDIGLYTTSMSGEARYNSGGMEIQPQQTESAPSILNTSNPQPPQETPISPIQNSIYNTDPHVHIHIDNSPNLSKFKQKKEKDNEVEVEKEMGQEKKEIEREKKELLGEN